MRDRPIIVAGLLVFLGAVTLPVWYNVAAGTRPSAPLLAQPSPAAAARVAGTQASATVRPACVLPRDQMRASHMQLLAAWREDVVRRGDRAYVASGGVRYTKSLTGTCLGCHEKKADFCDRCHGYAGVSPACWDCHVK